MQTCLRLVGRMWNLFPNLDFSILSDFFPDILTYDLSALVLYFWRNWQAYVYIMDCVQKLHREGCQLAVGCALTWWQFSRLIFHQIGSSWRRSIEDLLAKLHTKIGEFWSGLRGVIVNIVWSNERSRSDLKNSAGLFLSKGGAFANMLETSGQNVEFNSKLRLLNFFRIFSRHFEIWFAWLGCVLLEKLSCICLHYGLCTKTP